MRWLLATKREMAAGDKKKEMSLYYWKLYFDREKRFASFVDRRVPGGSIG
jgi:hypothetical protein